MTVLAYHFARDDGKLGYGDGREIRIGETLRHEGTLELCESGLHASERAIDALQYAQGTLICRVDCSGKILADTDKLVCMERKVVAWIQPEEGELLLRRFARQCALDVFHLWKPPDIVRRYIETGDESIRAAARAAARDAARAAAREHQNRVLTNLIWRALKSVGW